MISKKLSIFGLVQGVGFRPFVYNLAKKHKIFGFINNDDEGVNIEVYAKESDFEAFLYELQNNLPPLALINKIKIEDTKNKYYDFQILSSTSSKHKLALIPSDIAICEECIKDIEDSSNLRYNYALTNCINCGPRYSIIEDLPYDRINTSLKFFPLCEECKKEFTKPNNRRYHAQAISCEKCGPITSLYDKEQKLLASKIASIKQASKLIKEGKILAIKAMGGFHIVCDATNDEAIKKIREFKKREYKPFALMFRDLKHLALYSDFSKEEGEILSSKERAIVLVNKKEKTSLSSFVSPNMPKIGAFLVNTALQYLLFKELESPIVATSANLKSEPIIKNKEEIFSKLYSLVDFVLDYNRDIVNSSDDSIVQVVEDKLIKLRNSRGFAPLVKTFPKTFDKKVLALGANQKASITLAFDNIAITSPYLGDLESLASIENYKKTIEYFEKFYNFKADIIVCDKHPLYESTKIAKRLSKERNIPLVQIQHHYAHILSVLAENLIEQKVLAFVFDGTAYGDDSNIWGAEVFIADNKSYKRVKHLKYFRLLGSNLAIKEPRKVALAMLFDNFSLQEVLNLDLALVKSFSQNEINILHQMWLKALNSPLCSSMGRLFDAVASLADILHFQEFEGQTGLLIESFYDENIKERYSYDILDKEIDLSRMIKELIKDKNKVLIASKFINTLVKIILDIVKTYNLPIVLCGGVFQNKTLLSLLIRKFKEENLKFYINEKYSPNDESISIGQAFYKI